MPGTASLGASECLTGAFLCAHTPKTYWTVNRKHTWEGKLDYILSSCMCSQPKYCLENYTQWMTPPKWLKERNPRAWLVFKNDPGGHFLHLQYCSHFLVYWRIHWCTCMKRSSQRFWLIMQAPEGPPPQWVKSYWTDRALSIWLFKATFNCGKPQVSIFASLLFSFIPVSSWINHHKLISVPLLHRWSATNVMNKQPSPPSCLWEPNPF